MVARGLDAFERVERAIQVALDESFVADDFVNVEIAWQDECVESGAVEFAKSTLASALVIVTDGGGNCLAGRLGPGRAAVIVLIDPRFAAFVAEQSADAPAAGRDLVDHHALVDGFRLKFFEQRIEHRVELVYASGAVEFWIDDVARKKSVLEGVKAADLFAFRCARTGRFEGISATGGELSRGKRGQ